MALGGERTPNVATRHRIASITKLAEEAPAEAVFAAFGELFSAASGCRKHRLGVGS